MFSTEIKLVFGFDIWIYYKARNYGQSTENVPLKKLFFRSTPRMAEHFVRLFTNLKKNPIGKQTLQAKVPQSTRVLQKCHKKCITIPRLPVPLVSSLLRSICLVSSHNVLSCVVWRNQTTAVKETYVLTYVIKSTIDSVNFYYKNKTKQKKPFSPKKITIVQEIKFDSQTIDRSFTLSLFTSNTSVTNTRYCKILPTLNQVPSMSSIIFMRINYGRLARCCVIAKIEHKSIKSDTSRSWRRSRH